LACTESAPPDTAPVACAAVLARPAAVFAAVAEFWVTVGIAAAMALAIGTTTFAIVFTPSDTCWAPGASWSAPALSWVRPDTSVPLPCRAVARLSLS